MVRGATHIAGNRLDLVMTDAPDVDVLLGTPLGTSDRCFVNCELLVEQVIPEHNIRHVVHLKHRINWDNVRNAVRSLSCNTILRSADPIGALNSAVNEVGSRFVPTTVVRSRSGYKHWFDSNCRRAYDAKKTAYHAWSRECGADLWNQFCALSYRGTAGLWGCNGIS